MKIVIAAASALSLSILTTSATSQDDAFQNVAHDYVEQYLRANPEHARAHGKDPGRHRTSESQSATSSAHSHRNGDRADAGRNQSRADRTRPSTRSGAANEEGASPVAGQNRCCARGLQKMAPEGSTPPLRWRLSSWRGEVQEETALRAGVGLADGRNHETGKGRSGANTNRHLRNGVAALQKKFPECRSGSCRTGEQTQGDGCGSRQARRATPE